MQLKALIIGINGQDGSYLAEYLLSINYDVVGTIRRNSVSENQTNRIEHIKERLSLEYADLTDITSIISVIKEHEPDEIYNLGAQSHVQVSFKQPIQTMNADALGVLNLLEAVRLINKSIKIYQASSSEMFGNSIDTDGFQRETTSMMPVSPYGCSKVFAYNICNNYKNAYGMFICNGILFNHESPRRGSNFVTSKVVNTAVDILKGVKSSLVLGNLYASRDWGHAKDYVKAMHLIMQLDNPDNFVCATGETHTVKDLVDYVFNKLEIGIELVSIENKYKRPEELNLLKGDPSKLKEKTGWEQEYNFYTMLDEMIENRL